MIGEASTPCFGPGVKFRFDEARETWVVLAPERMFTPDETATEILKLVDGERSVGDIADVLAARFEAPRAVVLDDVVAFLQELSGKGAIRL